MSFMLHILLIVFLLLATPQGFAEESVNSGDLLPITSELSSPPRWHFLVASGLSQTRYDADFESRISQQKSRGGTSQYAGTFDLPIAYYQVGRGFGVGPGLSMTFEHWARYWRDGDSLAFNAFNFYLSQIWSWNGVIGEGGFLRADVGYSRLINYTESRGRNLRSDVYFGAAGQIGLGWGWKATRHSRIVVMASTFHQTYNDSHFFNGFAGSLGFLFFQ